jgi:hypothetical protein
MELLIAGKQEQNACVSPAAMNAPKDAVVVGALLFKLIN